MAAPTKLLFIGLDAAERDLLLQWSDEGLLPNLAKLARSSLLADSPAMPGLGSGALWPSFAAGVTPSVHGRFFGFQMKSGTYETHKYPSATRTHAPFWETLSQAGRQVAVMNVPYDSLCSTLSGLQVVDWGVHNPVGRDTAVSPADLTPEFAARCDADLARKCDTYNPGEVGDLVERLVRRVEMKADLACRHLDNGGWDLFLAMFDESHCVGHQCWHLHDTAHPLHNAALARQIGDPVKAVYVAIDTAIGRLLERAGPDTTVIFFSGTGMGPNYSGNHLLDEILAALDRSPPGFGRKASTAMRKVWHKVPPSMRAHFRFFGRRVEQSLIKSDRGRRSSFAVLHNDISGAVRVNLAGREPNGRIQPGAEFDTYCRNLARDLLAIVNDGTGRPLATDVVVTKDRYPGAHEGDFADLFVVWDRRSPIDSVSSPKIGTIKKTFTGNRTGDHTDHGLFMARAKNLAPGRRAKAVSILDFAPTVAACLSVNLANVQGKPVQEVVDAVSAAALQHA